jgi:hypothetical protein
LFLIASPNLVRFTEITRLSDMVFGFCAEAVFVFFPQDSPLGLALHPTAYAGVPYFTII